MIERNQTQGMWYSLFGFKKSRKGSPEQEYWRNVLIPRCADEYIQELQWVANALYSKICFAMIVRAQRVQHFCYCKATTSSSHTPEICEFV
jgi:hypothetical protein